MAEAASDADARAVQAMIGRDPRGEVRVARRCHLGLPAVVEVAPVLPDGTPFPTLFWLTCPLAVRRVSTLESEGLISVLEEVVDTSASDAAHRRQRDRRIAALRSAGALPMGAPVPTGGVAGVQKPRVKCLHARYAWWLAGGDDPAGEATAARVGRLDCIAPCLGAEAPGQGVGQDRTQVEVRRAQPGIWPDVPAQEGCSVPRRPVDPVRRDAVFALGAQLPGGENQ